jgi:hypothetical protein
MNAKEKKPSKKFHLASKLLKQLQYVTQMLICYFIIYRNEDKYSIFHITPHINLIYLSLPSRFDMAYDMKIPMYQLIYHIFKAH